MDRTLRRDYRSRAENLHIDTFGQESFDKASFRQYDLYDCADRLVVKLNYPPDPPLIWTGHDDFYWFFDKEGGLLGYSKFFDSARVAWHDDPDWPLPPDHPVTLNAIANDDGCRVHPTLTRPDGEIVCVNPLPGWDGRTIVHEDWMGRITLTHEPFPPESELRGTRGPQTMPQ